ncbi:MAG: fibrobacter succinogenes major paralogous domain-containing protein [Candidatus Nomurabacteria bacterium]|nr:fibrobacter succinogenes major paralogous domain-containing protein [Candidatus Nomurabacteria bacterium]
MPDNRCWMITNLAYAQGNHYTGAGAWSSTTTVPYYTDPHADSTVHDGGVSGDGVACPSPSYRMSANQINYTECGFLYNWPAVTAATICPTGWSLPTGSNGQANTTNNDFHALYQSLGTSKTGRFTALVGTGSLWKGVYSGYFNTVDALFSLGIIQVGQGAAYWSSTAATELGDGFRRTFGYSTSGVGLNNDVAGTSASRSASGNAIRCVANK